MMPLSEEEQREELELLRTLEERNVHAFIQLYRDYGDDLLIYAYAELNDRALALKAFEELFEWLWTEARFLEVDPPVYLFLRECLDRICKRKLDVQ